MRHVTVLPLLSLLLPTLVTVGCDCCPTGGSDPPATQILDVVVEPTPVRFGETTTFTAIIRDSTETGFVYKWRIPSGSATTTVPRHIWKADIAPGEYYARVQVQRDGPFTVVQRQFLVNVIP